jgi:UDP-N-acetyl-D-mannosaminuronic acid transferase (WecB/TagA/CpsF family)
MSPPPFPTKRMLGIDFFVGTAAEAIAHISKYGGLIVAPAAPSFIALQDDPDYRRAIADADLAIADSGWAVLFWRLLRREKLTRISGLALFKALLETADARITGNLFFILPSEKAKAKTLEFTRNSGYPTTAVDCYVAPKYQRSEVRDQRSDLVGQAFLPADAIKAGKGERLPYTSSLTGAGVPPLPGGEGWVRAEQVSVSSDNLEDRALVAILEARKPKHVIIGIGGGVQEKLGFYLREHLSYRPAIHCIGAALAFLTGDQKPIPMWADRIYLGWFLRLARAPHQYARRFSSAFRLPGMIWRYGSEMPPVKITK